MGDRFRRRRVVCAALLVVSVLSTSLPAQQTDPIDLSEVGIEELMHIKVTTVSKRSETLASAPAAAYVITQEQIRRSGALTVADALRLAPGVHVAQINADTWAIGIRGDNFQFADKLLVMIDGRSVYSPIFSGVFWELHDLPLEDIARIEVVRGPGGTLWGANAMNGVINIITKTAQETRGVLLSASIAANGRTSGTVRVGGGRGRRAAYRLYGKYLRNRRSPPLPPAAGDVHDGWDMGRAGFRADLAPTLRDRLTLSGDVFRGREEGEYALPPVPPLFPLATFDFVARGGNVLVRWEREFSPRSSTVLQAFYDREQRAMAPGFAPLHQVYDIDFQHRLSLSARHQIVWGGGFRANDYDSRPAWVASFDPARAITTAANAFLQDEVTLVPDRLWVEVGSKFERNTYTGFEMQPNVRLRWQPTSKHMIWAAVSRALTVPNDFQEVGRRVAGVFQEPNGPLVVATVVGNRQLKSQDLLAYEAGYRTEFSKRFAGDVSVFFDSYHRFASTEAGQPYPNPDAPFSLVVPLVFRNSLTRHSYGAELSATCTLREHWKLEGAYSWLVNGAYPMSEPSAPFRTGDDPKHQFSLRSSLSLPRSVELDSSLYYVSSLGAQGLPDYVRLDLRLGWRIGEHSEFSLAGQNLLDPRHPEFAGNALWTQPAEVRRTAYAKFTINF